VSVFPGTAIDETPLLIDEVATQVGVPFAIARTNPPVELEIADTVPVVPRRSPESDAIESWFEIL
jgi:hypothetical protein